MGVRTMAGGVRQQVEKGVSQKTTGGKAEKNLMQKQECDTVALQ